MKPILVAIDFSSTSIHALEYAIMIANKINTNVIMTWVDKEITQNHIYSDTSGQNRVEALRRFRELSQKYGSSLNASLTFDCKLRKGKVYQEIVSQARNSDACMIITGSHGASGFEELMIGSMPSGSFPIRPFRLSAFVPLSRLRRRSSA
ncbi:MAG: universal stress protein [Bacteroidetes bacterium]|nr:universal stress protein [Bacteroidota bacterium]